jgi:hypothetical protein
MSVRTNSQKDLSLIFPNFEKNSRMTVGNKFEILILEAASWLGSRRIYCCDDYVQPHHCSYPDADDDRDCLLGMGKACTMDVIIIR